MMRRGAIAVFVLAVSLVVACGHQVSPNPSYNDLSGDVVVKFAVNGTLDFTNVTYAIVIDTCANGTPFPDAYVSGFNSYSYGFFVGGAFNQTLPQLVEYYVLPNSTATLTSVKIPGTSSLEQYTPNYNGMANEFELIFSRSQLDNPFGAAQPCPNLPAVKVSPSASAGASPTATPAPGSAPTVAPTAAGSPTPNPYPTTAAQATWVFNFFTIQNQTIVDSLGIGGANDNQSPGPAIDTTSIDDLFLSRPAGSALASNPSAAISGGEIQNYP